MTDLRESGAFPIGPLAAEGIELRGPVAPGYDEVLTLEALRFVAALHRDFEPRRRELLARRRQVQARLETGWRPQFLPETQGIRDGDWTVASIPADLMDRRVEITGPVERKMIINALNSGARVYMADFEDATAPTWANVVEGQVNLRDAVAGLIEYAAPDGRVYQLADKVATLVVRPRGWHLPESHLVIDGAPISGSLFDFGLFFFHNAARLLARDSGPYFYLPKLENHLEARLWNEVFVAAQQLLGIPRGSIRATVLIETILAAFEMDEILYELREHCAGLNCGRWDYIFSVIKKFRSRPEFVMPDRGLVTMDRHFMRSYSQLAVRTCHRRRVHAIGGMAAQIPVRDDDTANAVALAKVVADKEREVEAGHDGTWVAHPGLVRLARDIFDRSMPGPNQIARRREDVRVSADDLLTVPEGAITEAGVRHNITVGVLYLEAWLRGNGCVPIFNLMEDAATAEISRSQLWQWRRHGATLDDGRRVDAALYHSLRDEELDRMRRRTGDAAWEAGRFRQAASLLDQLVLEDEFTEFLTLPAYDLLLAEERAGS